MDNTAESNEEQKRKAFEEIYLLFESTLNTVAKEEVRRVLSAPCSLEEADEDIQIISKLGDAVAGEEAVQKLLTALPDLRENIIKGMPATDEELAELLAEAAERLSNAWVDTLDLTARANSNILNLAELDEYMLPTTGDPEMVRAVLGSCYHIPLGDETIREVLRHISTSLPKGQLLPEAAINWLKASGITVT